MSDTSAGLVTKVGRNDPCPCGSGAKFKKCCEARLQAERQADRQRERIADGQVAIVYHGTCESQLPAIRREGLRPQDGVGPFVTDDESRAAGYAVRAACVELFARGLTDVRRARRAVVLELLVDRRQLVADSAHRGDSLLVDGCPWPSVRRHYTFDPAGHVRDDEVEGYAKRAAMARSMEAEWQDVRLGAGGDAA